MSPRAQAPRALAVLWLAAALAPCAVGADWTFEPVLSLSARHTDNARQVDRPDAGTDTEADDLVSADLSLVLAARTPRSQSSLTYLPSYDWYRDNRSLDSYAHNVAVTWGYQPVERVRWEFGAGWTRTERARLYQQTIAQPVAVVPDTTNQSTHASLGASFQVSPRTTLRASLGGRRSEIELAIPDPDGGTPIDTDGDGTNDAFAPLALVDNTSTQTDVAFGLARRISPLASIGGEYRASRIDEGIYGARDVHRALVTGQYGSIERVQWTLALGAAKTSVFELASENLGRLPAGADPDTLADDGDEPAEAVGSLIVTGSPTPRTRLSAGLVRDVGGSSGLSGASVTDLLYADAAFTVGRYSTFSLRGRVSRFAPLRLTDDAQRTRSSGASAEYAWALSPRWFFVFGAETYDQSTRGSGRVAASATTAPDLKYTIYSLGVRWSPAARPRPAMPAGGGGSADDAERR